MALILPAEDIRPWNLHNLCSRCFASSPEQSWGSALVISATALIFAENILTLVKAPRFSPVIMRSNSFQARGPDLDKIKLKKGACLKRNKTLLCHIFARFLIEFCIYIYRPKVSKLSLSQLPPLLAWELLGRAKCILLLSLGFGLNRVTE